MASPKNPKKPAAKRDAAPDSSHLTDGHPMAEDPRAAAVNRQMRVRRGKGPASREARPAAPSPASAPAVPSRPAPEAADDGSQAAMLAERKYQLEMDTWNPRCIFCGPP